MIIDVHNHVQTKSKSACERSCSKLESLLDNAGIDYALVMSIFDDDYNLRKDSDILIEVTQKHTRLLPIASFDLNNIEESTRAIVDYLDQRSIVGVKFFTGYQDFYPTDKRIKPVIHYSMEKETPVMFHTGTPALGEGCSRLRYCLSPWEFDDLAFFNPDLKICLCHCNSPNFMAISPVLEHRQNVKADLSGLFVGENDPLKTPYVETLRTLLYQAITYLENPNKLMFGTDHPYCSHKENLSFMRDFFEYYQFPETETKKILWSNAMKFFNLEIKNDGVCMKKEEKD